MAVSRASSRRAICNRWTRSVVRVNRTRQPFSTRAKPSAAARWLLPPPGGAETYCPIPGAGRDDLLPLSSALRLPGGGCAAPPVPRDHHVGCRAARRHHDIGAGVDDDTSSCSRRDPEGATRSTSGVAGRQHAVMRAQRLVAPGLILPRVGVEIAEGSRQAVAAMLQRGSAERPQCILSRSALGRSASLSSVANPRDPI